MDVDGRFMAAKNDTMYDISVFSFLDGRTLADASSRGLGGRSSLRDDQDRQTTRDPAGSVAGPWAMSAPQW